LPKRPEEAALRRGEGREGGQRKGQKASCNKFAGATKERTLKTINEPLGGGAETKKVRERGGSHSQAGKI